MGPYALSGLGDHTRAPGRSTAAIHPTRPQKIIEVSPPQAWRWSMRSLRSWSPAAKGRASPSRAMTPGSREPGASEASRLALERAAHTIHTATATSTARNAPA